MEIALQGFGADVTEADIREALEGFGCTIIGIKIHGSDQAGRSLAIIDIDTDQYGVKALAKRINGHTWKGNMLRAETFLFGNK